MVDYGISIMAFLRSCKIGYHWKAFEGIVKWPYQITDWNPVCIFSICNLIEHFCKRFLNLKNIDILYPFLNIDEKIFW